MPESFFQLSQELAREFAGTRRLRLHVDYNEEEQTLVYEYFRHTFLALLNSYPDFPLTEVKKILQYTGEAVKELHAKDWIHIGETPKPQLGATSLLTYSSSQMSNPTTS